MDFEDGALMEPLSVGVHAVKKGNVALGSVVLITGAGPIGLVTIMAAKAFGASKIIVTEILDIKLKKAKEVGADYCIMTKPDQNEEEIVKKIKEALGEEPTVSIECTGTEQCTRVCIQATKSSGRVVLVGLGNPDMKLPVADIVIREVDVVGIFRYVNDYPLAIEMVKTGKVKAKSLVTHHFKLEDTVKAFNTAKTGEGNPIKILIHPNANWKP